MKHNRLVKRIWSHKSRTRPGKLGLGIILAAFLALLIFSVPDSFAKKAVLEKLKEQDKKEQTEAVTTIIAPKNSQPAAEISPVKPEQNQVEPASAVTDKGKQIPWHVISSGADCGSSSITYRLGAQDGCELCGTVGQLAVGAGSSPSYNMNSGYWQESLQGGYVCGDCNGDEITNIADIVCKINYLFLGVPLPCPPEVVDHNGDSAVNVADVVAEINYLFLGVSLECPLLK